MISAHIATIPSRVESLRKVLNTISPQVDKVYVMLNGHTEVPSFLREFRNVEYEMLDNRLGDSAKLMKCFECQGLCLVLDDDLIPSLNLRHWLEWGLKKYGGVVGLHGRNYPRPVTHFKKWIANYRCLGNVKEDVQNVDLIGTGVMMFDSRQVKLDSSIYDQRNKADVLFSRLCYRQRKPMTVLAHHAGQFIKYIPQANTIWRQTKDDSIQTKILNTFIMNWGVILSSNNLDI